MTARTVTVKRTEDRPTARQIYAMAHALVDIAGLEWPETRGAASEMIQSLQEQRPAVAAAAAPAGIPF